MPEKEKSYMKLYVNEKNGYPDNNFTEDEYMSYIKDIKKQLVNAVNNFERLAAKQLEINERGDYNSILTAEDEEELFKRCALIHSANNFLYICDIIQKR